MEIKYTELPKKGRNNYKEQMAYREKGAGAPLLLLHGNMSSSFFMEDLMIALAPYFHVYAPDLRGFGDTTYENHILGIEDFAQDLFSFMDNMGIQQACILGWSLGGAVAMEMVATEPERFTKLLLLSSAGARGVHLEMGKTFGKMQEMTKKGYEKMREGAERPYVFGTFRENMTMMQAKMDRMQENLEQNFRESMSKDYQKRLRNRMLFDESVYNIKMPDPELKRAYEDEQLKQRNAKEVVSALENFNITHKTYRNIPGNGMIDKITIPTLLLHGREDKVVDPAEAEETATLIGDNAKVIILENVGHFPMNDDFNKTAKIVTDFFLD